MDRRTYTSPYIISSLPCNLYQSIHLFSFSLQFFCHHLQWIPSTTNLEYLWGKRAERNAEDHCEQQTHPKAFMVKTSLTIRKASFRNASLVSHLQRLKRTETDGPRNDPQLTTESNQFQ